MPKPPSPSLLQQLVRADRDPRPLGYRMRRSDGAGRDLREPVSAGGGGAARSTSAGRSGSGRSVVRGSGARAGPSGGRRNGRGPAARRRRGAGRPPPAGPRRRRTHARARTPARRGRAQRAVKEFVDPAPPFRCHPTLSPRVRCSARCGRSAGRSAGHDTSEKTVSGFQRRFSQESFGQATPGAGNREQRKGQRV